MRTALRTAAIALVLLCSALTAAGCGGSADKASAGVPELGFMTWRDQTGVTQREIDRCEKRSKGRYTIKAIPMGPTTDAAREQLTRRLAAKDPSMDFINLDTIWTAEFSDAGWLLDVSAQMKPIADQYVPASLASTYYKDKYWAMPVGTNAALLFYRTDLVKTPPKTWEELARMAKEVRKAHPEMSGFVFQGNQYEGSTVDALEFMGGAGAEVLSKDGKRSTIDKGDGAEHALTFLKQLFDEGIAPKVVTTFQEEEGRLAFQNGSAIFMRNWPYAYAIANSDPASKVKGKFDVVPLPKFEGRGSASVLGGQNYGISNFSDTPELAWEAIMCLSDEVAQQEKAIEKGELPTLNKVYDDPKVNKALPFLQQSRAALDTGVNRPVSPYYGDITIPIYKAWNDVASGRLEPADAVKRMDVSIQKAADGEAEI